MFDRLKHYLFGNPNRSRSSSVDGRNPPIYPTPNTLAPQLPAQAEISTPPLNNWSHPFKDPRDPLAQLTHLAKAEAGFYPLGVNGLWHGGVHFDAGTAGTLDQSSVHCLADGEVVAYRFDTHSPTTQYVIHNLPVNRPFSRNFVLVRHRLQAPKIEGSADVPPSLTLFSLYLHLQDWAVYQQDTTFTRPGYWPEGETRYVKATVNDSRPGAPEQKGLNVRSAAQNGKVIDLLPRGAKVTVSGEGRYRKVENSLGPQILKSADGSLRGYLSVDFLEPIHGGQHRIKSNNNLNIRAQANALSEVIAELPRGTEVTISGEGTFRKLERVNQYVHYPDLQGALEPQTSDQIVLLDQPVAIKAGDLIGHIGLYHGSHSDLPEKKLHLEVFSGNDVELFIEASRAWAERLPVQDKTWLKLAKGTRVIAHQEHYSASMHPIWDERHSPLSDADLLLPKSLLDSLPMERKIVAPANSAGKAYTWYRLEGLLHDADRNLLNGWVREEVGVTPWVSPWSWEGYDVIYNFDGPEHMMASFRRATNRFNETQLERFGAIADEGDEGPIKQRLYDIVDRNRDGQITADELQAALSLPAHAQSISQLIIRSESEWYYRDYKWDALDEILGHSGSTPHLNWLADKGRLRLLSWWDDVAEKVGLPGYGKVCHFHPVGVAAWFMAIKNEVFVCKKCDATLNLSEGFLSEICGRSVKPSFIEAMVQASGSMFNKYGVDSCNQVTHLLAQAKKETGGFLSFRESLNYSRRTYTAEKLYRLAPTAINAGFARKGLSFSNEAEKMQWIDEHLIGNDSAYGEHCFGSGEQIGKDFRGRGLIHLTHWETYKKCADETGLPIDENPELLENHFIIAIETALWFWKSRNIASICENPSLSGDAAVIAVTRPINSGLAGLIDRQQYKREITHIFNRMSSSRCSKDD
jgi:predicted chitinase